MAINTRHKSPGEPTQASATALHQSANSIAERDATNKTKLGFADFSAKLLNGDPTHSTLCRAVSRKSGEKCRSLDHLMTTI
jgi:hypothetical protein